MLYHHSVGSGPELVLLHGFGFNHAVWDKMLPALQANYTVHLIDLPGHGGSDAIEMPDTVTDCVDQLLQVLPANAHVVGWSLGGLIALKYAHTYPDRVRTLSLVSTSPRFLEDSGWLGVSHQFFDLFHSKVSRSVEKALKNLILTGLVNREQQREYCDELNQAVQKCKLPKVSSLLNALTLLAQTDLRDQYNSLNCPVRFFVGNNDPLTPVNALVNPIILPAVGHFPLVTSPLDTAKAITSFVDENNES